MIRQIVNRTVTHTINHIQTAFFPGFTMFNKALLHSSSMNFSTKRTNNQPQKSKNDLNQNTSHQKVRRNLVKYRFQDHEKEIFKMMTDDKSQLLNRSKRRKLHQYKLQRIQDTQEVVRLKSQVIQEEDQKIAKKQQERKNKQSNEQNKDKDSKAEGEKNSNENLFKRIIFILTAAATYIFLQKFNIDVNIENQKGPKINPPKSILTETQLLTLLQNNNFNHQVIILRQKVPNSNASKTYYQNLCMVKQTGKTEPIACAISDLPKFLQKIQKITVKDYKLSFVYSFDQMMLSGQLVESVLNGIFMGLIIAGGIYTFRAMKKNGSFKGMGGITDQALGLKKFQAIKPQNIKTYFKDVAGMHEAKSEITQFVDFLKNPDKYIEMGAKVPKGALLTGPPGTGKTLLARACAGEAGVPFYYVSGSEFVQKYVGLGANRVRSLFASAAKNAPSIIFIDEIDAIGKKRDSGPFSNEERDNTLNQLLVNMDGFDSKHKIIVMAATNLKDHLDPALLRPGRFDRSIEISLPNFDQRAEILQVHLKKVKFSSKYTIEDLSKKISILTPGFSGAELANICNEAAILAARESKEEIDLPQFQKATERVMVGLEKRNLFSEQEKENLAYYECGKTVVSWFTEGSDPIIKISIAPFSRSGSGYSHEIKDEMPLRTKQQLLTRAECYLAGRCAEKHFKKVITSNGEKDLAKAKRIIMYVVTKFGMTERLGTIAYPDIDYVRKPYSEHIESIIDEEVSKLTNECQSRAEKTIQDKAEQIELLKIKIMEKETLTHESIKQILGNRPFESENENYKKYLKNEEEKKEAELKQKENKLKQAQQSKSSESIIPEVKKQ